MKKTEIVCVIDQSGSMNKIVNDAIGGFNAFVSEQLLIPGTANITLVLFNHEYTVVNDAVPVQEVPLLTGSTYKPSGSTALYDAIGKTINSIGVRLSAMNPTDRPDTIIFAILTDGEENASKEFTKEMIAEMIKHQEEKYSWQFLFLAANQDAFATSAGLNIQAANTLSFDCTAKGMARGYSSLSDLTRSYRI